MSDSKKKNTEIENTQKPNNNASSGQASRRKLLKAGGIVASSALISEKWQKPVVESVLLPAHAQTSMPLIGPLGRITEVIPTDPEVSMLAENGAGILDSIISPAYAQAPAPATPAPTPCPINDCVTVLPPNASNQVQFTITTLGTGMLTMTSALGYSGIISGFTVTGVFNETFTGTQGTVHSGCDVSFVATVGGTCGPV